MRMFLAAMACVAALASEADAGGVCFGQPAFVQPLFVQQQTVVQHQFVPRQQVIVQRQFVPQQVVINNRGLFGRRKTIIIR